MGYATGWDMDDEDQMEEERGVRDEEPVLLIGYVPGLQHFD